MIKSDIVFIKYYPLGYKLQSTNEKLTLRTGVTILGEYLKDITIENTDDGVKFILEFKI